MGQLAIPIAIAVGAAAIMYLTRPQPPDQHGPRIQDLKVTDSAYGKVIPLLRGIGRVGGNVMQASEIREIEHKESISGGKGGGGASSYTYTAEVDLAMYIGEGVIDDVLRIWADGKIIMDKTATNEGDKIKKGLVYRFYKGTEDQLPDPCMEALVGEDMACAYRGIAYIVFEKFDLKDYGNRIPQITVEYAEFSDPVESYFPMEGDAGSRIDIQPRTAIDYQTRKGYIITGDGSNQWENDTSWLVEYDIDTMTVLRKKLFSQVIHPSMNFDGAQEIPGNIYVGPYDHRIYISCGQSEMAKIIMIDPVTLQQGDFNQVDPVGWYYGQLNKEYIYQIQEPYRWIREPEYGPREILVAHRSQVHQMVSYDIYGSTIIYNFMIASYGIAIMRYFHNSENWYHHDDLITTNILGRSQYDGTGAGNFTGPTYFAPRQDRSYKLTGWLVNGGMGTGIPNITHNEPIINTLAFGYAQFGPTIVPGTLATQHINYTTLDPNAVGWGQVRRLIGVDIDDTCILFVDTLDTMLSEEIIDTTSVRHWAVKLSQDEIVWIREVPRLGPEESAWLVGSNYFYDDPRGLGGVFKYASTGSKIVELNVFTGEYTEWNYPGLTAFGGFQAYDALQDAIYVEVDYQWTKILLGRRAGQGVSLASIISRLCEKVGLTADDIDVTELEGAEYIVNGYQGTKVATVRANIEPLQVPYTFYCVESDYKLRFRATGAEPMITIHEGQLLNSGDAPPLREQRVQEVDLPAEVSITFPDPERDHNANTATFRRPANPMAVMHSDNKIDVEIPVGDFYTKMKRATEKHLYSVWMERWNYIGKLPWTYMWLDPGDEIVLTTLDGSVLPQRLVKYNLGADFSIEFEGISSDAATYTSTVAGESGYGVIRQTFSQSFASRLFVLDLPLLSDTHNPGDGLTMDYLAASGYGPSGWRGATLHRSADNTAWTEFGVKTVEVAHGVVYGTLPDNLDPFAMDYETTLRVYMVTGKDQLESCTYEQLLAGANAAAVVIGDGKAEVVQFLNATQAPDGSFLLTGLARGRRGTDVFCGMHGANETFVLLQPAAIEYRSTPATEVGSPFYYKAVTIGQLFQEANTSMATSAGNDLKPYMPSHITATTDAGGIQLEWVRRTRIGGALIDLTGEVPLSEASEEYEVDIYDALGTTVVRTLAGITAPGVLYATADITTDFGTAPATLNVMVYQMSATVGRGLSRMLTLTVGS